MAPSETSLVTKATELRDWATRLSAKEHPDIVSLLIIATEMDLEIAIAIEALERKIRP